MSDIWNGNCIVTNALITSLCSWTYLEESERSGMAVLEVNIPTGYFIHQPKLDRYVLSGKVPTLKRARYMTDKVLMYFEYVSSLFI